MVPQTSPSEHDRRWRGEDPLRLLVGPYHLPEHWEYMRGAFDDHDAVTFGTGPGVDVPARATEPIEAILERLPDGWRPDLLVLWRPEYGSVPWGLEGLDIPVVMLTSDWYLEFSDCVETARFVNCVITGSRGKRVFEAAGFDHVLAMPMLGYEPGVDALGGAQERDIDVFYAGSTNWSAHARREHVLASLLDLPDSVNLVYRTRLSREEYADHMSRSKIVINLTVIGEINMRVYEACAAGSCLFVEAGNLDVPDMLEDGVSAVYFDDDNLVERVLHYLAHDDERESIARAGHDSLKTNTYRANMNAIVDRLRRIGREGLLNRGREIVRASRTDRIRHYLPANLRYSFDDTLSLQDIVAPLRESATPRDRLLLSLVDYAVAVEEWRANDLKPLESDRLARAVSQMLAASREDPEDISVAFDLAAYARHHADAAGALALMDRLLALLGASSTIPFAGTAFYAIEPNDDLRRRFERTAWESVERGRHPGSSLRALLLARVHQWKAEILFEAGRLEAAGQALAMGAEAAPADSDCALLAAKLMSKLGRHEAAIGYARGFLIHRPLHTEAWLVLAEAQIQIGDTEEVEASLARLHRIHDSFGDRTGALQIDHLRRRLREDRGRERPTARATIGS